MRRVTWWLLGILVVVIGVGACSGSYQGTWRWLNPQPPSITPDPQYLISDQTFGCTQPLYPEIYQHDYKLPDGSLTRIFGILRALPGQEPDHLPALVWLFWKDVEGPGVLPPDAVWLTLPGKDPEQITIEELKVRFGNNACNALMPYYPKAIL